ncbi:hypothetical protein MUP79_07070 [Candidatus Bathyarchaeota archaeon]|nr:hypothetical protein [Candidatus Bathyarchaeota archaeon]
MQRISPTFFRGRGQVIYRFLPGCLIDVPNANAIARVSKWSSARTNAPGEKRILEKIYSQFGRYGLGVDKTFPPKPNTPYLPHNLVNRFAFFEPNTIELELYPLTVYFRDTNEYFEFKKLEDLDRFLQSDRNRNRVVNQTDLVLVSQLGGISSLQLPSCPDKSHGRSHILLEKRGESQRNFVWVCGICRRDIDRIWGWVDGKRIGKAEPVRAQVTYLAQTVAMVNVRGDLDRGDDDRRAADSVIIAKYLELLDPNTDLDSAILEAEKMIHLPNKNELDQLLKQKYGIEDTKLTGLIESVMKDYDPTTKFNLAIASVEEMFPEVNARKSLAAVVYEYLETRRGEGVVNLRKLREQGPETAKFSEFARHLSLIGVENAYYVERVPLIVAAYGYCRGSLLPGETQLRAFASDGMDRQGKIPIYLNITESEGILLELDRGAVVNWLHANQVIQDVPAPADLKPWFLQNVNQEEITTFSGAIEEGVTKSVFGLVHSMSHALHKRISEMSGLGVGAVGELLFPNIPAILLYSHEATGFTTGGLKDLFENKIYPWVDLVISWIRTCVYDPVCLNGPAACHHCLLLPEASCSHFNQDLSRVYLLGRAGENPVTGFWTSAVREILS